VLRFWTCWAGSSPAHSFTDDLRALGPEALGVFYEFFRAFLYDVDLSPGNAIADTPLLSRWLLDSHGGYYGLLYAGADHIGSSALGLRMFRPERQGQVPHMELAIALDRLRGL
jgi:hypothetical protein